MMGLSYREHFTEIAGDHSLPLGIGIYESSRPLAASGTGAVYRPDPTWCVKMLEPGTAEAEKFPAERAILEHVTEILPVPRLLAHGVTRTRPVRVFCAYEWIEGRLWQDVLPNMAHEDRLRLLHEAGGYLGKLHAMDLPTEYELTEIPLRHGEIHWSEYCSDDAKATLDWYHQR